MKETTTTTKKRLSNQHRSVCTGGQLPVASIALPCPIRKGARRQCTVLGTQGTGYFNLPSSNIALGPAGPPAEVSRLLLRLPVRISQHRKRTSP